MAAIGVFEIALILLASVFVGGAVFRSLARGQQRRHAERMKALELGGPLPEGRAGATLACLVVGGAVPLAAIGFAAAVLRSGAPGHLAIPALALAACIGLGGVIGGSVLALRLLTGRPELDAEADKPPFDPDAYDIEPIGSGRA